MRRSLRPSRRLVGVVLAVVVVLLVGPAATPAEDNSTPPPTAGQQEFRAEVNTFFDGLSRVLTDMQANPLIAQSLDSTGVDALPRLADAQEQLAELKPEELGQLQTQLDRYPSWQEIPDRLSDAVAAFDRPVAKEPGGVTKAKTMAKAAAGDGSPEAGSGYFTNNCVSAGNAYQEFTAVQVLNYTQTVLNIVVRSIPGSIPIFVGVDAPNPAKLVALAAAYAVNVAYLALSQTLAVAIDCAGMRIYDAQVATLPLGTDGSTVVPASSQRSIDELSAAAAGTAAKVAAAQTMVTSLKEQAKWLQDAVGDPDGTTADSLNATLDDSLTRIAEVQGELRSLQPVVDVLNDTQKNTLDTADAEIASLGTSETLQVRMAIERNLAGGSEPNPLALFQLPQAAGGYLETVQSIVTETIGTEAAAGNDVTAARKYLAVADAAFAAGQYKSAYAQYREAYRHAY